MTLYTLEEAEKILARRECDRHGHDIESTIVTNMTMTVHVHDIWCARCKARFEEKT